MQIQDFHAKLTSGNEPGILFQALRNLRLVEDARTMFSREADDALVDWAQWPPAAASVSGAAVQA